MPHATSARSQPNGRLAMRVRRPLRRSAARPDAWRRLDRYAANLNVALFLFLFAIGPAMLDLPLLFSHRVLDRLTVTRIAYAKSQSITGTSAKN